MPQDRRKLGDSTSDTYLFDVFPASISIRNSDASTATSTKNRSTAPNTQPRHTTPDTIADGDATTAAAIARICGGRAARLGYGDLRAAGRQAHRTQSADGSRDAAATIALSNDSLKGLFWEHEQWLKLDAKQQRRLKSGLRRK